LHGLGVVCQIGCLDFIDECFTEVTVSVKPWGRILVTVVTYFCD